MNLPLPVTPRRFWAALWLLILGTLGSLSSRLRRGRRFGLAWLGLVGCGGGRRRGGRPWGRRLDPGGRDGDGLGPVGLVDVLGRGRCIVAPGLVGRGHRDVHRLAFEQRRPLRDAMV